MAPGPRGLGGFSRAGDGGGNGWEYQVDGTVPAKARSGWNLWVTQAEWHVQPEISMWEGEGREFGRKGRLGHTLKTVTACRVAPSSPSPCIVSVGV